MTFHMTWPLAAIAASVAGPTLSAQASFQFKTGAAGFTTVYGGADANAWVYDAKAGVGSLGAWFLEETQKREAENFSALVSPVMTVKNSDHVTLTFSHRYSFADKGTPYDGGQVQISVNGEAFKPVSADAFTANGYNDLITGQNVLQKEFGFTGTSDGFDKPSYITSSSNLGTFFDGTTIQIRFVAAWDESLAAGIAGGVPNWEFSEVTVSNISVPEAPAYAITLGVATLGWACITRSARRSPR